MFEHIILFSKINNSKQVVPLNSKLKLHSFAFSINLFIVFSIKLFLEKISFIKSLFIFIFVFIFISSLFIEIESEFKLSDGFLSFGKK